MIDNYITRGCFRKLVENTGESKCQSTCRGCNKLDVYNWLESIPEDGPAEKLVEVRFKNTRKGYYVNNTGISLVKGDIVAVEVSPGHDIGIVSLTGDLVAVQMKRHGVPAVHLKKIYRKAKHTDMEKWSEVVEKEQETICVARQMVSALNLNMKISDVEYQGDKTKATFYYISDERIDFRELIREFADRFKVRIEMKQIGARQESAKVGGIGACGRELCCTTWMSSFMSVSTSAARYQELSPSPQKLAGQCGKLKCCLNYELKCYTEVRSDFPDASIPLETEQGRAYHSKTDVYRRMMWYSFGKENESALYIALDVDAVKEIIRLNRQGIKVKDLVASNVSQNKEPVISYQNAAGEDSINRFEEKGRKRKTKLGKNTQNVRSKGNEKKEVSVVNYSQKQPEADGNGQRRRRGHRGGRKHKRNKPDKEE